MAYQKFRKCTEIDVEILNNFIDSITALMHVHKLGRHDLCDKLNVSYNSFSRIMLGQQHVPISLLLKCCEYFGVTIDQLLKRDTINMLTLI